MMYVLTVFWLGTLHPLFHILWRMALNHLL